MYSHSVHLSPQRASESQQSDHGGYFSDIVHGQQVCVRKPTVSTCYESSLHRPERNACRRTHPAIAAPASVLSMVKGTVFY